MNVDPMSSEIGSIFLEKSIVTPTEKMRLCYPALLLFMIFSISLRLPSLYTLQPRQSRSTLVNWPSLSHRKSVAREISNRLQISLVLYFLLLLRVTMVPSLVILLIIVIVSIVTMILKLMLLSRDILSILIRR